MVLMQTTHEMILTELKEWEAGAQALADVMEKSEMTVRQYTRLNQLKTLIERQIERCHEALAAAPQMN
jgi:hypothetical protein